MTVSSVYTPERFSLGSNYVFSFEYIYPEHVFTAWLDANGALISILYTMEWDLAVGPKVGGRYQGGAITLHTSAPSNAQYLGVFRSTRISQNMDYPPGGRFPSESHEFALDKLTLICQEIGVAQVTGGGGGGGSGGGFLATDGSNRMLGRLDARNGFALGSDEVDYFYSSVGLGDVPLVVFDVDGICTANFGVQGSVSAYRFFAQHPNPGEVLSGHELTTKAYVDALLGGTGQLPDGTIDGQTLTWDAELEAWIPWGGVALKENLDSFWYGDIEIRPNPINLALRRMLLLLTQNFGASLVADQATEDLILYQTDNSGAATKVWAVFKRGAGFALNHNSILRIESTGNGVRIRAPDDINGGLTVSGGIDVTEAAIIRNTNGAQNTTALVLQNGGFQIDNNVAPAQKVQTYFGQLTGVNWHLTKPATGSAPIAYQWVTSNAGSIAVTFQLDGNVTVPSGLTPARDNDLITKKWATDNLGGGGAVPNGSTTSQTLRWDNSGTGQWVVADGFRVGARGATCAATILATSQGMAWSVGASGFGLYQTTSTGAVSGNEIIGINPAGNLFLSYNKVAKVNTESFGASVYGEVRSNDGSIAGPAYAFTSEVNTGMYRSGTASLGFAVTGSQRMRLTSSGMVVTGTISASGKLTATSADFSSVVDINSSLIVRSGASILGGINANSAKVSNVAACTVGGDAANKTYVDNAVSDMRLKCDLEPTPGVLDALSGLDVFTFKFAEGVPCRREWQERRWGLSAQQVQQALPDLVHHAAFDRDDKRGRSISGEHYLGLDYADLVPVLVKAVQELTTRVQQLEARLG